MRLTLLRIVDRTIDDDALVLPSATLLRDALQRLHHDVEMVTLTTSLARTFGKLEATLPDAIWPIAVQTSVARERGPAALTLVDELSLPSIGATSRAVNRCFDDDTRRALLIRAGLTIAQGDPAPGSTRVFISWMAGARKAGEPLGAVSSAASSDSASSGESFEPFVLAPKVASRIVGMLDAAAAVLSLAEWALFELHIDAEGQAAIVSVDPLPVLDDASAMLASLQARGLTIDTITGRILGAAKTRLRVSDKSPSRSGREPIRVGLIFNVKRIKPSLGGKNDEEAEFDSPATIEAIANAIRSHGHSVVLLEANPALAGSIRHGFIDVVFNIAEGLRGRSRESQVPALLELCDIPYTGSDPATLLLALDKGLAKRIVRQAGVPTPNWFVMQSAKETLGRDFNYPVVVKPIAEGSSKGVLAKSVAENEAVLREAVRVLVEKYPEGVIVEEFLPGREFTVGLLGENKIRALPPMEIVFRADLRNPIYTFDHKLNYNDEVRYDAPAKVDPALLKQIEKVAKGAFQALGCRDVARVDLRMDARGVVNFIECNPLPGLTPKWSDLCMIAQSAGMDYNALIGEILAPALRRFRAKQAALRRAQKGTIQT